MIDWISSNLRRVREWMNFKISNAKWRWIYPLIFPLLGKRGWLKYSFIEFKWMNVFHRFSYLFHSSQIQSAHIHLNKSPKRKEKDLNFLRSVYILKPPLIQKLPFIRNHSDNSFFLSFNRWPSIYLSHDKQIILSAFFFRVI